jgi:hypothetical protein
MTQILGIDQDSGRVDSSALWARVLVVSALALSSCAINPRHGQRITTPPLPLKPGEFVVSVNASVECDSALRWRPTISGWTSETDREKGASSIRTVFDADVIDEGDFRSFVLDHGTLPVLVVENAEDDCGLWAIQVEVGPIGWMTEAKDNDVLLMDYASHGLWHREEKVWIE